MRPLGIPGGSHLPGLPERLLLNAEVLNYFLGVLGPTWTVQNISDMVLVGPANMGPWALDCRKAVPNFMLQNMG